MLSGCTGQPGRLTIGRPSRETPSATQVVAQAHRTGGVVAHCGDAPVGGAGPQRKDGRGSRREPVDPRVGQDRLSALRVGTETRPVTVAVDLLVGHRALEYQNERVELAASRVPPGPHEVLAALVREHRIDQDHRGHPRKASAQQIFEARVGRSRQRDRVAVATQAAGEPQHAHRIALVVAARGQVRRGSHGHSRAGRR